MIAASTQHTCARKQVYQSDATAKAAARQLERRNGVRLTYYRCLICHHFHLTKWLDGQPPEVGGA